MAITLNNGITTFSQDERRRRIMAYLNERVVLRADVAVQLFGVSHSTLRRDFRCLADDGLVDRVRGGIRVTKAVR